MQDAVIIWWVGFLAAEVALALAVWRAARARLAREHAQTAGLVESEWFARSTLDSLSAQIAVLDSTGVVLTVNQTWRDCVPEDHAILPRVPVGTNYLATCDTMTGKGGEGIAAISDGIRAVSSAQRGEVCAEYHGTVNGAKRWFLCRITRFPGNAKTRIVVSHEQITARKQIEEAAEQAKRAADAANQAKSAFLANMSHEIRTPMSAILGYADLLLDPALEVPERARYVQVIRRNGEHLLSLINDVLDISKIEANKYVAELVRCDLRHLLCDIVALTRVKAIQKGLNFKVIVDGPVPKEIQTDPLRLKQILINLIGNAVKFTTTGGVYVRVSCHDRLISSTLHVEVVDTGIGMSQQQIAGLFRPFSQADESTTRRFGGTGLGLVISKRLAQLLGGDISVQSELGSGTCFSIWVDSGQLGGVRMLPALDEADLVSEAVPHSHAPQRFDGKVLVAEDGEDNQHLISLILRNAGLEPEIVPNGRIAMEKALTGKFDLILMDMQMPEMDGYSATRALREKGYKGPICALTANAMADDRARCISAGCDEYIAKPIRIELLGRVLAKFLKVQPNQPSEADAALAAGSAAKLRSSLSKNETLKGVLERFVSRLPQRIDDIQRLLRERDLAHLAQAVHQMKGAAGGYGFPQLTSAAGKAEESIKRADDIASIAVQINQLVNLIHQVDGFPEAAIPAPVTKPAVATPPPENAPRLRVDPETGLPNRNHMLERLSTLIALARRRGGPLACIAIQVRMAEPQAAVIKRVAALLESCCQQQHELFRVDASNFMLVAADQDSRAVQEYGTEVEKRLADPQFADLAGPGGPALAMAVAELRLTTMSAAELSEEAIKSLNTRQMLPA